MNRRMTFDDLLDAIESLPLEQQESLVEVLQQRLAEMSRQQIDWNAAEARQMFKEHKLPYGSVDDLMGEM
jgi:hypothetical protein